jgi:hypothetical protein
VPLAGITDLTVRLSGLSYATRESGDLRAYLIVGGVGTQDHGVAVPLFEIGSPPGGGGYTRRDFQGTYTFSTSFVRPLVAGPTGVVEPGEYTLAADPQALLARLGNLGGVGAPGRVFLQLYDEYVFNGAGSLVEWELTASLAPTTTAPEPGSWALLGNRMLGIAVVGAAAGVPRRETDEAAGRVLTLRAVEDVVRTSGPAPRGTGHLVRIGGSAYRQGAAPALRSRGRGRCCSGVALGRPRFRAMGPDRVGPVLTAHR